MKNTCNFEIIKYLETQNGFQFGGKIARAVHDTTGVKESVVERRMREMWEDEILEKTYEQVNGKGPKVVLFRIRPKETLF